MTTRSYWIAVFPSDTPTTAHPRLTRGWADRDANEAGIVAHVDPINGITREGEPFSLPAGLALPTPDPRCYASYLDRTDLALVDAWAAVHGLDRTSGTVRRMMRDFARDHDQREVMIAALGLAVAREVAS